MPSGVNVSTMKIATAKAMATVVKATRAANSREGELGSNEALSNSIAPASFALSGGLSML